MREKEEKKKLEDKIQALTSQVIDSVCVRARFEVVYNAPLVVF
jgi:hypothetical protein